MRRRSGMTLVLVLLVMLIGGFFVYVAFDMAGNAHNSSMNMVTEDRLYNAAQSGLEWGKAILVDHYEDDDLNKSKMVLPSTDPGWEDLRVQDDSGNVIDTQGVPEPDSGINIEVSILSCNYDPPTDYIDGLPPVWNGGEGSGVGSSSLSGVGSSGFIDPNRNLLGNGADGSVAFVVRSRATFADDNRSMEVETMVVMNDE